MIKKPRKPKAPLVLDKKNLVDFINKNGNVTKRDIVAEFGIKGEERRKLNALLREIDADGTFKVKKRDISREDAPSKSDIYQAIEIDEHGELWAQAVSENGPYGTKFLITNGLKTETIGIGDRFIGLSKINNQNDELKFEIKVIKKLEAITKKIFGVLEVDKINGGGRIVPADKKQKQTFLVLPEHINNGKDGDLVSVRLLPNRGYGPQRCEVLEILGNTTDPKSASILAIAAHGIPMGFSDEEMEQAKNAQPVELEYRKDLRNIPFVTIDPEDARDHDDAVYARSTESGHLIYVAIADVSHYVTHGSSLDKGALKRGNSVYFPDRVVPMLPFELSADLCSLREHEERACLCVEIRVDNDGNLQSFEFSRGLMRSVGKLSYLQAQNAIDGNADEKSAPLLETVLKPLWNAYEALKIERAKRCPLEIESNERRIILDENGKVESISTKERFDAHKLIEEFMILANVCAATAIENKNGPVIYRVHDIPSAQKVAGLADFLATLNIKWTKGETVFPRRFNKLLEVARETEHFQTINEQVLRTQAQAVYSPDNLGHFGLQLIKYAHFTSPIRRYADLMVHRALIHSLNLGGASFNIKIPQKVELENISLVISSCERRAMAAERDATDRYLAAFLSERLGAVFDGRITSVTSFGVFIRLEETGGDGLVPITSIGDEYFIYDEAQSAIIGSVTGDRWELGMRVRVRLIEAAPISGGLIFDIVSEAKKGPVPKGRNLGTRGIGGKWSNKNKRTTPSRIPKNVKNKTKSKKRR